MQQPAGFIYLSSFAMLECLVMLGLKKIPVFPLTCREKITEDNKTFRVATGTKKQNKKKQTKKTKKKKKTKQKKNRVGQVSRNTGIYFLGLTDFNFRDKVLTAKLLKQGYWYHKLRKPFIMQLHKIFASYRGRINMTFICATKIKHISTDQIKTAFRFSLNAT